MKRCLVALLVLTCFLTGCKEVKTSTTDDVVEDENMDSTEAVDGEETIDDLIAETPMPMSAEVLFDDFFFNFASNKKLQMERIAFPLLINSGEKRDTVEREEWQMEHFFMHDEDYILIFDSEEQMELVKSTAVDHVIVEKIFLERAFVKQYLFSRTDGRWMLYEVRNQTLPRNPNASFLEFYQHFVSDSLFQRESLDAEIDFAGPDPDDDFETMEGVITPDFWDAFAPEFPTHIIYNVVYGQQDAQSPKKVLVIRGISNGMEIDVTFEHKGSHWKLTKLTE